ncbi:redoxin domain-containing protein [Chitinophaga sp. 30R24]|uniref:redoxin domain-containing protein n=1 Tax=Chitinophaga sp. 30R24 TaxID=3248838 RepID=UPI003B910AF6
MAQPAKFTLNGKLNKQNGPEKVYLNRMENDKLIVDSVAINNGAFSFEGMVDGPVRTMLILDHKGGGINYMQLPPDTDIKIFYLEKGTINLEAEDNISNANVISPLNKQQKDFKNFFKSVDKPLAQINKAYQQASSAQKADKNFQQQMAQRYKVAIEAKKLLQQKYVAENPDSYFSLEILEELAGVQINPDVIGPLFKKLSERVQNTPEGKSFAAEIAQSQNLIIGSVAPNFEVPDINGNKVKLSDFKGKTVLLDFWGSWLEPCRQQHQYVREAYNKFKDKNFTVISIALDPPADRSYMLKAIQEDSLVWTNLSDPNTDKNEAAKVYIIKTLPQNYLIDSSGTIFNKNLQGASLMQQLNSLLLPQNN